MIHSRRMDVIDGGLRSEFRKHLPRFHWQSIESGLTGGGIPDANYCYAGKEGWVEYKLSDTFPRLSHPLSPDQIGWLERRHRAGGRVFIAVRYRHSGGPRLGVPVDRLYLYSGSAARSVALQGLSVAPLARFEGGPSRWGWPKILEILLKSQ